MLRFSDVPDTAITSLLDRYGLELVRQSADEAITGSFWGDPEAGIVSQRVFVRDDTPIHSLLHETCHIICMSADRRASLERDAGGDALEEAAVCYLQVVLAGEIAGVGRAGLMRDMDDWGYSFRLGSTEDWFRNDAEDARQFLTNHGLLNTADETTFRLRQ